MTEALGWLALGLTVAGLAWAALAARAVRRLAATPPAASPALPASILKPLHGADPALAGNLAATLAQSHAAPFEVVAGVNSPADSAVPVAEAAFAGAPTARLLAGGAVLGPNRKVSQLIHLAGAARHPVLVVADADMAVPPHWLTAVTAPLAEKGVGLVTCLYRGEAADDRLWSRLGALWIDWQFLPNAALGEALGQAQGCYGATMALRAETLAALGGFESLAGLLADDHALGVAVRRLGLRVVVAPVIPGHVQAEPSLLALARHELRWLRTLRLLNLGGYAGMVVTYPLVWGAVAAALLPGGGWALAAALAGRLGQALAVDHALGRGVRPGRLMLLPLRDALSFAIWGLGLARGTVVWQGRRYRMDRDGGMIEA
ncbi:bacteriohopanetetrol glucosamine biosynthesis glycosyltransferase HpnI [Siccirubricoccus sp. KC 17139]|uniref:Bacteriohopanetetrol glucosamine biosynthesis glycosyltransferase HpnI n=1 Tax=Siccirubricoccus soli TaxID=2899147 RepID=A0ABT1DB29_9PROT|nr:bacteriohopanetetrol glucosamine biosynthesis glycosyltransferase HpnI [Siccirubricoccus soli]MCO6419141.1 bacteriohopanetetrol glucosamine biosynthesis glycosyltransferase HpnI [Siccirubricoccus soli]MCP2685276.1 bacteriohopanetetrol glucosamine biosynthesis glycosyltransferase HpnI [Siccirubricoccus soli]